jgi:uncharacterized protein
MHHPPAIAPDVSPVAGAQRMVSIDVLRGFAVLGILVMNIQSYSMIGSSYSNPHAYGDLSGLHYVVWYLSHLLCDMKFMALFSMLFGAGIVVMQTRREQQGLPCTAFHYRRTGWLLMFGLIHAYGIWYGDILVVYSLSAFIVFWAKRWRPRTLIVVSLLMLTVSSVLSLASGLSMPYWDEAQIAEFRGDWMPDGPAIEKEVAAYRGSWREQLSHRVPMAWMFHTFLFGFFFFWRTGGLMLMGMALFKTDVFSARRSKSFYRTMTVFGLGCGLPIVAWGVSKNNAVDWDIHYSFFQGAQFNYWGSIAVAFGYVGVIMLACQSTRLNRLTSILAKTGQMAFTNYLSQSVICTLIFYGHGWGRFGTVSRVQQIGIVAVILLCQIAFSNWWLARFRFGPLEWLWRSLSYWKLQSMSRPASE